MAGYSIPGENSIVFDRSINLGAFPSAQPTLDFVLSQLATTGITFNDELLTLYAKGRGAGLDKIIKLGFNVGGNAIEIRVTYDPTSESLYPTISDITYCQAHSVNEARTLEKLSLDDTGSLAVQVASPAWGGRKICFSDWLTANQVTNYPTLPWTSKYTYFIMFLRGQVK